MEEQNSITTSDNKKVYFVILHYLAYEMTLKCVTTLLQTFTNEKIAIIIVDNGSYNDSGIKLKETFKGDEAVHVILNTANLGFAAGNNTGYCYCRNFSPDFIIVMNNDVLIKSQTFIKDIQKLYIEKQYAVLGPDIYNPQTKRHQSPLYLNGNSIENVIRMQMRLQRGLKHFRLFYITEKILHPIKVQIKNLLYKISGKQYVPLDRSKEYENPVLQGACYIFSKEFIQHRQYAFHPGTFLYFEEDILHLQCTYQGLKILYSPTIQVEHLEDVSTNMILNTDFKKEKMKSENLIHSYTEFIKCYNTLTAQNNS